jgi:uncharacterized protein YtpQ (UPF0354 family)
MSLFKKLFSKRPQSNKNNPATDLIIETHKSKIYPWVKVFWTSDNDPRNTPVQIELKGDDSPIKKDWLGDLGIFYVADMGDRFQVVLERDLPKNMTKEELHQIAVNNLKRDIEVKLCDAKFGGHGLTAGGDHEAGSICIPEVWEELADRFGDNLIIVIPAKDLVAIVPEHDTDNISNMKIFVHEVFKDCSRLLTRNVFKYIKDTKEWEIIDRVN